jgi:hypothetical protein
MAFAAVLVLANTTELAPVLNVGLVVSEALAIPDPSSSKITEESARVKVYAGAVAVNCKAATTAVPETPICVLLATSKVAVPVGTALGGQLPGAFQSAEPGKPGTGGDHRASCPKP